ncbi:MAG: hypothetical protein ACRD88_02950, partial [Terriglobia bacterium]
MAVEYVKLVEREQSVLLASLISLGLQRQYFEEATGWSYGVQHHKYESRGHHISKEDFGRLRETVTKTAGSESEFWSDYIHRGTSKASRLINSAQWLVKLADDVHRPQELVEGFTAFAAATKEMAPFLAATPEVKAVLESFLTRRITQEIGGANAQEKAEQVLSRLLALREESEAVKEIRSCYRIASEIGKNDEALDLLCNESATAATSRTEREFPKLYDLIRHHIDEYGWIRTRGCRFEPLSPRELIERIQMVLLRWKPETIRQAADHEPAANVEQILGFSPSESLARLISALQDLITLRCFRIDVHLQGNCIARPFFAEMAETMGCTREQLMFSSVEEILTALAEQKELPLPEIDRRIRNGFGVERSQGGVRVHSYGTPLREQEGMEAEASTLTGQSVSLGRAVGTVKIIFGPMEVLKLGIGDVLVTAASTPDLMGIESAFPSRTGAPLGMEK